MQLPLEIVFEDIDHSDAIEARIREDAERLDRFANNIMRCRVVVRKPHTHKRKGGHYDIHIHITVPRQKDIVVSRDPGDAGAHEDVYVAIRDAFKAATRQLEDLVRVQRHQVKSHEEGLSEGKVLRLVPEEDYGIIERADGMEVYFHRNSVEGEGFESLNAGAEVYFRETEGEHGPHANFVRPQGIALD